jgi:phosphotransferase system HPr-like phosphotransfer protein
MSLKAVITIAETAGDPETITANVKFSSAVSLRDMKDHPVARAVSLMMVALMEETSGKIVKAELDGEDATEEKDECNPNPA